MIKVILVAVLVAGVCNAADWSYEGAQGPENWGTNYEDCNKDSQSPIHIKHNETVLDETLGAFKHSDFRFLPTSMNIVNNGHALQVNIEGGYTISDTSVLPANYKAAQFHLHWAAQGTSGGAEHWLDNTQPFAELHIVHYDTKYASLTDALNQDRGLAVLGIFITADAAEDNLDFGRLLSPNITLPGQNETYSTKFSCEVLLPNDISSYYRYEGSLTTPPCAESVVWTVFSDPIRISANQKAELQQKLRETTTDGSIKYIGNNFRPLQPINTRVINRSKGCGSAASSLLPSAHLLAIVVMGLFISAFNA